LTTLYHVSRVSEARPPSNQPKKIVIPAIISTSLFHSREMQPLTDSLRSHSHLDDLLNLRHPLQQSVRSSTTGDRCRGTPFSAKR